MLSSLINGQSTFLSQIQEKDHSVSEISDAHIKEFVVCILEANLFTSVSIFNIRSGEVFVCQYQDVTLYSGSFSMMHRFSPKYIITSETCKNSVVFTGLKIEFAEAQFFVLDVQQFQSRSYKDLFVRFLDQNKEIQNLPRHKQSIMYNCLCGLLSFVSTEFSYQINIKALNLSLYQLEDVMIYDQKCLLALSVLHASKMPSLQGLFKPVTNSGIRLLRGYLIHPLNSMELIAKRHENLLAFVEYQQNDKRFISNLREILKRFKYLDQVSLQLSQVHIFRKTFDERCQQTKNLLQQIIKIIQTMQNVQAIERFLSPYNNQCSLQNQVKILARSEEPACITQLVDVLCAENILNSIALQQPSNDSFDDQEKMLYLIKADDNQLLQMARNKYTTLRQQLRTCLTEYQQLLQIDGVKYKEIQKGKSLMTGHTLIIPKKLTEHALRQRLMRDKDSIHLIDDKGKHYQVVTEQLVSMNLRLQQAVEEIMSQTSLQVFALYQEIQQFSSWIFRVNQVVGQLDVFLAFADYCSQLKLKCLPKFGDHLQLQRGCNPTVLEDRCQNDFHFDLSKRLHLIYDPEDQAELYLIKLGQLIILSQIGCMVPAAFFETRCFGFLASKFKSQVRQCIGENQSSFTQEVLHLNTLLTHMQHQSRAGLVLCDQMVVSSAHEENIALNLAILERITIMIKQKDIFFLCASSQHDNLLINQLREGVEILLSHNNKIVSVKGTELEAMLNEEQNDAYNKDFIEKIQVDIRLPKDLCELISYKLQQQEYMKQKNRLIEESEENLFDLDLD